ncbi:InlB B-repeat-containing protein [Candidatus Saccharibacteria bacterium]|nr:InlB B-repeat-containing protein [Candidatus Saccharibacteria bacterium]
MTLSSESLELTLPGNSFGKTSDLEIGVHTDNYTGYNLTIASEDSTYLVNGDAVISSIGSSITEQTFRTDPSYNNMFGYKPSQYISSQNSVVLNTNFLPIPDEAGTLLDKTNAANTVNNNYTVSFGVKVNKEMPPGEYEYAFVVAALGNMVEYNVYYDANTQEAVSNMPSPNPQTLSIEGGSPTAQSYAKLSNMEPIRADKSFGGWCDVQPTYNSTTEGDVCSGTTYAASDNYPIDQTVDGSNITLYAIWLKDPFPVVWSQMGACNFNGATSGNITGSECTRYHNDKFIDTGIGLYSADNYTKDYEVHLTIDHYDPAEQNNTQDSQQTFVSDKLATDATVSPYDGKAPGMIVRRSGDNIQVRSTSGHGSDSENNRDKIRAANTITDISVLRIDGVIYVSFNNGPLELIQNISNFDQPFALNAWIGGYPADDCTGNETQGVCTNAKRYIQATFSNMYIRLGDIDTSRVHNLIFYSNGGTPPSVSTMVMDGYSLGELPTVNRSGWVFRGWYTEQEGGTEISASTVPHSDEDYWAHWVKSVLQAFFESTDLRIAVNGTESIVVTNPDELEEYTFTSNDTSVATVDPDTGEVTGVGIGSTTITMTGVESGFTMTIDVMVSDQLVPIYFDAGDGSPIPAMNIGVGTAVGTLPISIKEHYTLEGWYTGSNGTGTKLTPTTPIMEETQFYANWIETTYVCKIATTLHTETCDRTSSGCRANNNYQTGDIITYGKIPNSTTKSPGFAYTCDINADNTFDEETERFYYLATNNGKTSLIWYKNMFDVSMSYPSGLTLLPDANEWRRTDIIPQDDGKIARYPTLLEVQNACGGVTGLKNKMCDYLMEKTNYANTLLEDGVWIQKVNDGETGGRRIHTTAVNINSVTTTINGSKNAPRPVIELPSSMIEPYSPTPIHTITFNPQNNGASLIRYIEDGDSLGTNYPSTDPVYADHVFQGWYTSETGGTLVTSSTVPDSSTTYYAQWKKSVALAEIANSSVVVVEGNTASIVVTNAAELEGYTFASNDTSKATVDSTTGVVTGISAGYTTITMRGVDSDATKTINVRVVTTSDTFTISFDPQSGSPVSSVTMPAGNALGPDYPSPDPTYTGHVFQGWYTEATGGTLVTSATIPDDDKTYYAHWKLDVTQAIISNNDLTLSVGGEIRVIVTNTAELEGYSFSSGNSNIASIDSSTGVITGVAAGTTSIILTGNDSHLTKTLSVEVTPEPTIDHLVTFEANGGSSVNPVRVDEGDPIGTLPTTSRANYEFFGWYKDATLYEEVTPETVINSDTTFYAKWVENTSSFPIVWSEKNACTFGSGKVTGTYCTHPENSKAYLDTDKQLFIEENYDKDFEVGFTIVEYDPSANGNQATFVNSKQEIKANNYPGFVFRRYTNSATQIELTQKWYGDNGNTEAFTYPETKTVRVIRRTENVNGADHTYIYYSINNGELVPFQDITGVTRFYFDTEVWFGMGASSTGTAQRPFVGIMTDMYVRLGHKTDYIINLNANGGSVNPNSITVPVGSSLGSLPTPTPLNNQFTFDGWYDESVTPAVQVSSSTVPTGDKTYVAHYTYTPSDTPVSFNVSNNAVRGYQTIINNWAQSPVNLTTFNQNTPINSSTWGDTSELSEADYWSTLKNNFETNDCLVPSYGDAKTTTPNPTTWDSGNVDCSKPDAYDTGIKAPLNVYLYDLTNHTLGSQVSYAKAETGVIHNMIPGQTYYWVKDGDNTVYGYVTATSPNGRRLVDTGQIRNTRDLGGLPAVYIEGGNTVNGTLAYGKLFRGERLWSTASNATELTNLGINKEYDLSDSNELSGDTKLSEYKQDSVVHYDFDVDLTAGSNYMKAWDAVTDIMKDVNANKNIYFHCRVGADRTGTVAYILEGLLGVPDEARYEEYSLTHLSGLFDRTRYYKQKDSTNNLKFVYMMGYLRTTAQIYNWYMANPNADASVISTFRSKMVIPN